MNLLDRTEYNNSFNKSNKSHFYLKKKILNNPFEKIIPTFSISNYSTKNINKKPIFLKTTNININLTNNSIINSIKNKSNYTRIKFLRKIKPKNLAIKKIKIKKSSSAIFQNNDIDFVRNLNIDSMTQFSNNMKLKENLINFSSKDYFEKQRETLNKYLFEENDLDDDNNNYKTNKDNDLDEDFEQKNKNSTLPILNRNVINKSYEMLQAKNKKLKVELDEKGEKYEINKIKIIRKEQEEKKLKMKEYFDKIKELNDEINEIEEENTFMKELYLKSVENIYKDINQKGIDIFDEIIKYKIKNKFYQKNKKFMRQKQEKRDSMLHFLDLRKKETASENLDMDESSVENESGRGSNKKSKKTENFEKNMKISKKKRN